MTAQPTIVCPFCETSQPNAWDCSSCGRPLHDRPKNVAVQVETVDGLEQTRLDPTAMPAAEALLEGLETTSIIDSRTIATDGADPNVEQTALVDSSAIPEGTEAVELEATRIADEAPSLLAFEVTCRFCNTPWRPGQSRFCTGCGMKVEVPAPMLAQVAPLTAKETKAEEDLRRIVCPICGARQQLPGTTCTSCGMLVRLRS